MSHDNRKRAWAIRRRNNREIRREISEASEKLLRIEIEFGFLSVSDIFDTDTYHDLFEKYKVDWINTCNRLNQFNEAISVDPKYFHDQYHPDPSSDKECAGVLSIIGGLEWVGKASSYTPKIYGI